MAGESVEELLSSLTSKNGNSAEEIYAQWASLTNNGDDSLEGLVRRKLVAGAKSSQIKESLLATVKAGGATGESLEECLAKTGLTGFS